MSDEQTPTENTATAEDNGGEKKDTKTLGILLVHGIGIQRRGDTLIQCGGAIYGWLHDWLTRGGYDTDGDVEVVDTSIADSERDDPAHTRIVFREGSSVSQKSWLLAESRWADTFWPPSYGEFVHWTIRVLPIAIVLHLTHKFHHLWKLYEILQQIREKGVLDYWTSVKLAHAINPECRKTTTIKQLAHQNVLLRLELRLLAKICVTALLVTPLLIIIGVIVQSFLIFVLLITFLPIGFLRSFAGWVQKVAAATLGDSYVFVTRPLMASAAITKVQDDFDWLVSKRCDKVVILAHSQGAAVVYRAIEEWSKENRLPKELDFVITYGSGLQKLSHLKSVVTGNHSKRVKFRTYTAIVAAVSIGLASIVVLWMMGVLPLLVVLLSAVVGFFLLAVMLLASAMGIDKLSLPSSRVKWLDLFASHDPIPNGPFIGEDFELRQCEVVNRRSFISDHTTYWSAKDDFVGTIVSLLGKTYGGLILSRLNQDWLDVSAYRRSWRVKMLSQCRLVAGLAAASVFLLPISSVEAIGARVRSLLLGSATWIRDAWYVPGWVDDFSSDMPGWIEELFMEGNVGRSALLVGVVVMFLLTQIGFRMWEKRELRRFFLQRMYYEAKGVGLTLFTLGWLGVIALVPLITALVTPVAFTDPASWWMPIFLFTITGWNLIRVRKGPGTVKDFVPKILDGLLESAEELLNKRTGDRQAAIVHARSYFSVAEEYLKDPEAEGILNGQARSSYQVRAWLGDATALEQMTDSVPDAREQAIVRYESARAALESMGKDKDAAAVVMTLTRLRSDLETASKTEPGIGSGA